MFKKTKITEEQFRKYHKLKLAEAEPGAPLAIPMKIYFKYKELHEIYIKDNDLYSDDKVVKRLCNDLKNRQFSYPKQLWPNPKDSVFIHDCKIKKCKRYRKTRRKFLFMTAKEYLENKPIYKF